MFAKAPYGYHKVAVWGRGDPRYKLELDPPASDTMRRICDWRLVGATELLIAAELDASGANAPSVGRWSLPQACRILSNEVCCGTSLAARQDMVNPETRVRASNAFPEIVTHEECDLVQAIDQRPDTVRESSEPSGSRLGFFISAIPTASALPGCGRSYFPVSGWSRSLWSESVLFLSVLRPRRECAR